MQYENGLSFCLFLKRQRLTKPDVKVTKNSNHQQPRAMIPSRKVTGSYLKIPENGWIWKQESGSQPCLGSDQFSPETEKNCYGIPASTSNELFLSLNINKTSFYCINLFQHNTLTRSRTSPAATIPNPAIIKGIKT